MADSVLLGTGVGEEDVEVTAGRLEGVSEAETVGDDVTVSVGNIFINGTCPSVIKTIPSNINNAGVSPNGDILAAD